MGLQVQTKAKCPLKQPRMAMKLTSFEPIQSYFNITGQGNRERTLEVELTAENAEAPVIDFLFAFYSISSIFTPSME